MHRLQPGGTPQPEAGRQASASRFGSNGAHFRLRAYWARIAPFVLLIHVAAAADEKGLWTLWKQHESSPTNHAAVVEACRRFCRKDPADALVPVARGIEAWRLLKLGRRKEAAVLLTPYVQGEGDALQKGAAEVARGWITRMDREDVKRSLQAYYRKEVAYPATIDDVAANPGIEKDLHPRKTDRWGTQWRYRLVGFKGVPGFKDQRYLLESVKLGASSDLERALHIPYARDIRIEPLRLAGSGNAVDSLVQFRRTDGVDDESMEKRVFALGLGRSWESISLAYVGNKNLILCDRTHWKVFAKPSR